MKYRITFAMVSLLLISQAYAQKMPAAGSKAPSKVTAKKNGFELKGHIAGLRSPKIMMAYDVGGNTKIDTVNVVNGEFVFTGSLQGPTYSQMMSTDFTFSNIQFIENSKMTITKKDSASETLFSGSATEDENKEYKKLWAPLLKQINALGGELYALSKTDSASSAKREKEELVPLQLKVRAIKKQYIKEHPKSLVALVELVNMSGGMETKELQSYYAGLDKSLQESDLGKRIISQVEMRLKTEIGATAIDFTQQDTTGRNISLSSFKGKYVLIDFWASWCGPCRKENPNVVKSYNKYKGNGFEILGVSLDQDSTKWKEAIAKDQLTWIQLSDLKGWGNAVAGLYGVKGIPVNYLIDPKGIIIAKNLRGEDLEKKLAEIFAK